MKISFIEPHLNLFGGIRRVLEFANRLSERGHDVAVFHSDGSQCSWMECKCRVAPAGDVLNEEHDVIIYNDPNPLDHSLACRVKSKIKVFYVLALYERGLLKGFDPRIMFPRNRRMRVIKKILRSDDIKLVNSTWLRDWLKADMGVDARVLFGGINRDIFHPVDIPRESGKIKILCSGDPRERKGTKTVLEAFEKVKKERPRAELETYHGKNLPQKEMARVYSAADIFADAQWYAGWNNPVAEAMACKVPAVCTAIGGVKDFAVDGQTALLVPVKDPGVMANAIIRLIDDEALRNKLRENAYSRILEFDWERSVNRLEELLEEYLKKA